MIVSGFRLVHARFATTIYDGKGAMLCGGRWNSPGMPVVYLAESRSLAILETIVHLGSEDTPTGFEMGEAAFDSTFVEVFDPSRLPATWNSELGSPELKRVGDDWLTGGTSAVLKVPSVVVPVEFNYLLNPKHPDFFKIRCVQPQPFSIDFRLWRQLTN